MLWQMVVEDGQVMANVHITPMRASRALALRYLATKFGIDMENVAVGAPECSLPCHASFTPPQAQLECDVMTSMTNMQPLHFTQAESMIYAVAIMSAHMTVNSWACAPCR